MASVQGKVIAITGGGGGLGSAQARALAAAGAVLHLIDLPSPRLDALAAEVPATVHGIDVTDEQSVAAAFERIAATGRLDGLVISAGVQLHGEDGPAAEVALTTWHRTIEANLTGAFLACRSALPLLAQRPTSSIVLIGSPTGLTMSGAGYTAYSASKAGMMALARTIAADYAADGVRANVIVPGTMQTPLTEQLLNDPTVRAALLAGSPVGRLGTPDDLAGLATWLLSDESTFATGAFFAVDGGLTAR